MDKDTADNRSETTPAIRVSGLRKSYGSGDEAVRAVENVSFEVEQGDIVGLLGPNGAGKTTTIKSMLGVVVPDAGTVELAGVDVHESPRRAYDRVEAMLEGTRNVYWRLTVRENLNFFAGLGGDSPSQQRERHDALLDALDLADRADTPVKELSRGMKQKVALASTLASDVRVVLMDEPTLGLDVETSLDLRAELQRLADVENVTIVVSSHDMDVVQQVCDSVIVLEGGTVIAHESIDDLLDVFNRQECEIVVDGRLERACRDRIEREVDARITAGDDRVRIRFDTDDFGAVHTVTGILREWDLELLDIESRTPDLEDAFLELTGGKSSPTETDEAGLGDRGPTTADSRLQGDH